MDQETLLETFITEATELIQELEIDVVALEDSSDDVELINRIFRAAHTIKGSGGLVGLTAISDFTHSMESVLDLVRQRELAVTGELVSVLLRAVDLLKAMIKSAATGESCFEQRELEFVLELLGQFLPEREERVDTEEMLSTKNRKETSYFEIEMKLSENLLETGTDPLMLFRELEDIGEIVDIVVDARSLPDVYNVDAHKLYLNWRLVLRTSEPFSSIENVFIFVQDDSEISITDVSCHYKDGVDLRVADMRLGEILAEKGLVVSCDIEEALSSQTRIGELLVQNGKVKEEDVKSALDKQLKSREVQKATTIRVDTDKLDKLVNLVGEMVIAVARTVQQNVYESHEGKRTTQDALDMLQRISGDLQEQVMRVRMIPVEGLFSRFHRVVRDLANAEGKHVRLLLSGTETELDKNVVEQLSDPLKHLIRNSVDHGVESPGNRRKAGKPEEAVVKLSAYQQEGNIIIEVLDDGHGIDSNAIVDKAAEKGLINQGDDLDEREIYQLMFMPGFSTAKEVTEVSGRGVGLDVVKRNIDDLKGSIEVISEIGKGTTFRIKLPLTLAIIDGMNVKVGDEAFIIPLMAIVESIRPNREAVKTVEGTGEVIDARGEYLPLVRLYNVFDIETDKTNPSEALVVIVESSQRRFGILVDDVIGQQQAVIKSLEKNFRQVEGTAGATILGDGSVSLIIDIHGLERMAFKSFKSIQVSGLEGEAA
ncbi:MAG: chemotaxis protein CheA [Candidatus Aquicultor sp.]|nr:chemotaxis protein CheA [Candidatus Aquicultor sp.]